ncbi:MAG: leucine-rich repeat protein, partial [Clostridia bacterium]|nr:leucine-rich repeat protein [Clostridia bacterium]
MNQICVILALLMAFLPVGGTPVWDRVPAVVETAEPQPLDEAAADYLGVWIAYKLEAGGAAFDPETMGISLTVTLNADGTYALSSAGEEPESGAWRMTEEGARLDELMDDALLTLTDDGFLVTEEEGMALYFYKEGAEKPETAGPQPVGEAGAAYVGEWALEHIIMGGYQYNPALLGVESMTLILNADGAFSLIDADGEEQTGPWTADENGASLMGILPLSLDEEGRLSLEEDGLVLVFARADETPAPAETDSALYLGKWIAFEMGTENGTKIDPALMGMEISLAITADGAYELVSNTASEAEAGDWRMTDEGMLLIHKLTVFTGDSVFSELETSIPLTLTEDGFLRMEEEGIALLFYKEGAEKPETTILQPPGEAGAPFVGEWTLEQVYWGGEAAFDALNPPSGFLNLYEDGACLFSFDDEEEHSGVWTADENAVYFVGMFPMTLDADGRLTVDEGDSQLVFVRADEAPVPTDAEIARYVGTWIAYEAEMGGVRASVEMMGLEFTVTLNADGTLEENDGTVGTWRVTDEGAYLAEDGAETEYLMTMTDDGFLTAEVMGIRAYFYKEGTEKPETAGPQPVGDAGAAYVGEWVLSSLSMGGSTFSAADFGMTMSLTLNADGTFAMIDAEGEAQSGPWTADENGAFLMGMLPMALDADGHLVIEEDGAQMIFVHPGEEPPAPAPVDTPELDERCAPYVGEWHAVWIVNSSNEFDPRENWGIDIVLTLNADGTGEMDYMGSDGGSHWGWNEDKGCAYYGAWDDGIIPTTLSLEGELLMYGTPEEGYTLLSRDADAVYQSEPTPAPADDTDFVIDEETGLISAYVGEGGEVVVPAVINGVAVQGFEDWVFNGNDEVTAITLPEGITVLSYFGNDMENLRSVTLPESLLFIGDGSFQSPEAVEEITIPANVRYIGEFFLSYAYELKTITFEGECPVIINAFQRVPEDVVAYVPDDQLEAYTALLAEFGIGDVRPSGKNAPARVLQFNRDDFEFDAATGTVTAYTGTDAVVEIPAEIDGAAVRAIGAEAFADNWDVRYVGLPEGLETIGGNAFKYCGAVYVKLPSTLRGIASGAFYSYRGARIDLNEGLETIGEGAFAYSSLDYELMLPEGLKVIGAEAFAHSILLDEVYFPATLERIEEKAFYDDGIMYAAFAGYEVPEIAADAFGGDQLEYLADIDTPWDITRAQWEAYK